MLIKSFHALYIQAELVKRCLYKLPDYLHDCNDEQLSRIEVLRFTTLYYRLLDKLRFF